MTRFTPRLAAAALLSGATALAGAASSASSAASDSIGASMGSLSGSIQGSSNSSRTAVAQGDYRIIEVAAVTDRPGMLRLTLQPAAGPVADGEFFLFLPQDVAVNAHLAAGGVVTAHARPYGTEFAQGEPQRAFFLVLADEWYRELQARPVVL